MNTRITSKIEDPPNDLTGNRVLAAHRQTLGSSRGIQLVEPCIIPEP